MKSKIKTGFALFFLFLSVVVSTSCKKQLSSESKTQRERYDIEKIAIAVNGTSHDGSVAVSHLEDGTILNIDDGDKFVFLRSLPGDHHEIEPVAATTWIESDHGVVTIDKASGQIVLYANNDNVSRQVFERLRNSLPKNARLITVFDHTIVKGINS